MEASRGEVEQRRAAEGRESLGDGGWDPSASQVAKGWNDLLGAANAYEQALLEKLGNLKAEETQRLRLAALTEQSISTLAELLPPMVRRAAAVDTAIATATATAKTNEPELSAWVEAATAKLAKLLSNLGDAEGGSGGASQEAFSLAAAAMLECVCSPCTRPIVLAPDCPQPHAASGTPARRVPFPGPTPCSVRYTRSPRPIPWANPMQRPVYPLAASHSLGQPHAVSRTPARRVPFPWALARSRAERRP